MVLIVFLVVVFLEAVFFTIFLLVDFLDLETGNMIEKLDPHLNEE